MVGICESCGKRVRVGEDFVLEGAYPNESQIFANTYYEYRTGPESYGKIYHKKCCEENISRKPQE
jgi:hypothetical protein